MICKMPRCYAPYLWYNYGNFLFLPSNVLYLMTITSDEVFSLFNSFTITVSNEFHAFDLPFKSTADGVCIRTYQPTYESFFFFFDYTQTSNSSTLYSFIVCICARNYSCGLLKRIAILKTLVYTRIVPLVCILRDMMWISWIFTGHKNTFFR